jgi:hypothetical protein
MTEFTQTLRHYCRNARCRSKLPSPVSNAREAFCTKGCHSSFYRKRCLICECEMHRKTERQLICGKRRCRKALRARCGLDRYPPSSEGVSPLENPIKMGIESSVASDRPWRVVAGPEPSPSALHCATVGAAEAIEAINRTNAQHWREHNARAEEKCLVKRHDPPVNIVGGYKFPGAPAVDLNPSDSKPVSAPLPAPRLSIDRSLDIPDFLRRTSLNVPATSASKSAAAV